MKIFITGATGFIGSALAEKLVAEGYHLNALCRPGSYVKHLQKDQISIRYGDINDPEKIRSTMKGCDGIFHLAGYAKNWAKTAEIFDHINIQGTRNVLDAAVLLGIQKVVVTSTCMTIGPSNNHPANENATTPDSWFTDYDRTKRSMERMILSYTDRGLDVTIVNPTRVFGPGKLTEGNSVTKMIDLYIRGRWHIIPGNGQAVGNYAFIDDVVDGHISALHYGRPAERYILGGENLTFNEIFTQINTLTGLPRLLVRIPAPAAHFFAHLELLRAKISGHYPLITPDWSRLFMLNWAFSSDKARREIGYRITPFKQALDKTVMWLLYANGSA